jgi:lysophospholipase L1-like esterase
MTIAINLNPSSRLYPKISVAPKIIAIGDSVVYGYGDSLGGGWVERLRRLWMTENHNLSPILYNLGVRGDRVRDVLLRLEREYSVRGELRNQSPELIIFSVGLNDSARLGRLTGKRFTEIEDFQEQIERLLELSLRLAQVVFVGMTPVDESRMPFADCLYFNHKDQELYKEITRSSCLAREIPYLDIFQIWQAQGEGWIKDRLSEDGLHPNCHGHQAILELVDNWEPVKKIASREKLRTF